MNNITDFIKDAIAGGYIYPEMPQDLGNALEDANSGYDGVTFLTNHQILLDPLAWQAVGKTRGCPNPQCTDDVRNAACGSCGGWKGNPWRKMFKQFIDALCNGKDIDTALGEISQ